ncbi:formylglycine-generating enzyme family protein [Blastomonas fulva]|uniref:formylglycine-generating enzyme family protein n=1 Tax=Blastomonas fulva TaxID=1550728 RepID=UPI003F70E930
MVVIPSGSATLGSTAEERARAGIIPLFGDREGPTYSVTIAKPYAMGRTEVTRGQYGAFVEATGHPAAPTCGVHDAKADTWSPQPGYDWTRPGFDQDDSHPVVCISFDDASAYVRWLSEKTGKAYRIPSDAEWEYAARGGTSTPWYWGEAPDKGCALANLLSAGTAGRLGWPKSIGQTFVCTSGRSFTVPVAQYPANPFGLFDVVGNAFEWAADCNTPDNSTAASDGSVRPGGDCTRHYLKGGAFQTPFWLTRHAIRGAPLPADIHMFAIGLRVARALD